LKKFPRTPSKLSSKIASRFPYEKIFRVEKKIFLTLKFFVELFFKKVRGVRGEAPRF